MEIYKFAGTRWRSQGLPDSLFAYNPFYYNLCILFIQCRENTICIIGMFQNVKFNLYFLLKYHGCECLNKIYGVVRINICHK